MSLADYPIDRRDLHFHLFESPYGVGTAAGAWSPEQISALLDEACDFARQLHAGFRAGDLEGCRLSADGTVRIPEVFTTLWEQYRSRWAPLIHDPIDSAPRPPALPSAMKVLLLDLFMGANPSFMTYGAFTEPALKLIAQHGSPRQQALFIPPLKTLDWDACFCATEPRAGSDLNAIQSSAVPATGELFLLTGQKKFISAGMHQLTANTLYVVLARAAVDGAQGAFPSCFLVPRYWPEADGTLSPNHVECLRLEDKMGFRGCANTELAFGRTGPCKAFALGGMLGIGLRQVRALMQEARMYTGIFALGMSNAAFLQALQYARARTQGRPFGESFNPAAQSVPIVAHADVQRMLLEMKAKVDGTRALLALMASHIARAANVLPATNTAMDARTHRLLAELYLPLVKAYGSDEAWRICELSMQVHGGVGYLRDRPIEQYARDAKVLSIWEGANYMHAQELIREKLRRGTATPIWGHAEKELTRIMDRAAATEEFHSELAVLREALQATRQTLALLSELMSREQHAAVGHHCVRALRMLAELVIGALLLDVGLAAGERLRGLPPAHPDRAFYAGKQSAARFFVHNVLIGYRAHVASISAWEHSTVEMSDAMFGLSCQRRP